jgi:uncharacterized membrane protein YdbT with pleckstrin-like domain
MPKSYIENLLGDQERIILVTRQHWFMLVKSIVLEILLIFIIIAIAIGTKVIFSQYTWLIAITGTVVLLIPLATMIRDVLDWSNRRYIVTNRRVIQISGVFGKDVIDSSLEKVNDVKLDQSFLGRLFNYGDIEILTASELGANLFKRIGEPIRFKTAMINAKEQLERGGESGFKEAVNLPEMIAELDQLRQKGILTEEEFQNKKTELLKKI